MDFQALVLVAFSGFAVALASWALVEMLLDVINGTQARDEVFVETPAFRVLLPFVQAVARALESIRSLDKMRDGLDRKLTMAGKRDAISPDEILGTCVCTAVIGVGLG